MNNRKYYIYLLIIIQIVPILSAACDNFRDSNIDYNYKSFRDFNKVCIAGLPTFRSLLESQSYESIIDSIGKYTVLNSEEFEKALNKFFEILETTSLVNQTRWLNKVDFKKIGLTKDESFTPYVQKIVCAPEDIVALRGDMHGDIHSLLKFLVYLQKEGYTSHEDGFKIINKKFKLIFLGDYVDRGIYGVEVIYAILRLKIANPEQVFLVRGNHEDPEITQAYGFDYELVKKFIQNGSQLDQDRIIRIFEKLKKFYNSMPLAVYLGYPETEKLSNFVQCCHGGIELGFNPTKLLDSESPIEYQLIGELKQKTEYKKLTKQITNPKDNISYQNLKEWSIDYIPTAPKTIIGDLQLKLIGLMWGDFQYNKDDSLVESFGRGLKYNKTITEAVLNLHSSKKSKLCSIFRAHQHVCSEKDDLMKQMLMSKGIARMWSESSESQEFKPWQGMVCTLLLSPDGTPALEKLNLDFDTNIFIKPENKFENWNIKIVNLQVYKKDIEKDVKQLQRQKALLDLNCQVNLP